MATESDQALLCSICQFPPTMLKSLRLAHRLANDIQRVAKLVPADEQQKVAAIVQSAIDEVVAMYRDLPRGLPIDTED